MTKLEELIRVEIKAAARVSDLSNAARAAAQALVDARVAAADAQGAVTAELAAMRRLAAAATLPANDVAAVDVIPVKR